MGCQKRARWVDSCTSLSCLWEVCICTTRIRKLPEQGFRGERPPHPCFFPLAGQSGIIRQLSWAKDITKEISWWMLAAVTERSGPGMFYPAGHVTSTTSGAGLPPRLQERYLGIALLCERSAGWDDLTERWCICCHISVFLFLFLFSADANLLCVRAPVHSSVSPPWYYIPVCFSKGSPVTSHLGRDACELWMHCALGPGRGGGFWVPQSVGFREDPKIPSEGGVNHLWWRCCMKSLINQGQLFIFQPFSFAHTFVCTKKEIVELNHTWLSISWDSFNN